MIIVEEYMNTVTIPIKEYDELRDIKKAIEEDKIVVYLNISSYITSIRSLSFCTKDEALQKMKEEYEEKINALNERLDLSEKTIKKQKLLCDEIMKKNGELEKKLSITKDKTFWQRIFK